MRIQPDALPIGNLACRFSSRYPSAHIILADVTNTKTQGQTLQRRGVEAGPVSRKQIPTILPDRAKELC